MTSDHDLVLSGVDAGVCTLTLHNPERRNAWSVPMEERYFALLDEADADPQVRAIVVTGSGTTFCPGLDTQRLSVASQEGKLRLAGRRPQTYPLGIRKPMIAAINGACAGIGLMQALNCDVRFAARGARFTTAYARRGLPEPPVRSAAGSRVRQVPTAPLTLGVPRGTSVANDSSPSEFGSSWLLPRLIGVELAEHCSPRSVGAIRRQVYGDLSRSFSESMVHTLALMQEFAGNPDVAEGVASYVEKRPAKFDGLDPAFLVHGDRGY